MTYSMRTSQPTSTWAFARVGDVGADEKGQLKKLATLAAIDRGWSYCGRIADGFGWRERRRWASRGDRRGLELHRKVLAGQLGTPRRRSCRRSSALGEGMGSPDSRPHVNFPAQDGCGWVKVQREARALQMARCSFSFWSCIRSPSMVKIPIITSASTVEVETPAVSNS
jgi:hypothetical protein